MVRQPTVKQCRLENKYEFWRPENYCAKDNKFLLAKQQRNHHFMRISTINVILNYKLEEFLQIHVVVGSQVIPILAKIHVNFFVLDFWSTQTSPMSLKIPPIERSTFSASKLYLNFFFNSENKIIFSDDKKNIFFENKNKKFQ